MHCSCYLFLVVLHSLVSHKCYGFFQAKDCILSQWSEWSKCSKNCSIGRSTRSRYVKQDANTIFSEPCHKMRNNSRVCGSENNGCDMLCEPRTGKCHCKSGYELGGNKKKCFNVNECLHNGGLGSCSQKCVDTLGSYKCLCNNGFHLAPDGHDCIYNTPVTCSTELHLKSKKPQEKCVCKNGLDGTRCDRNPLLCSSKNKSSCHENDLCLTFVHAGNKCLRSNFQIPVLLKMKYKTYNGGNTVSEVEKYIEDILEGNVNGKSLDNLRGNISPVRSSPAAKYRSYYVESLNNVKVKSSFTYIKFGVLDVSDNFRSLKMNEVCSLLLPTDVQCVTEKDCNMMREDGLPCPTVINYKSAQVLSDQSGSKQKIKSWVYILISGFAIIIVLLIILLFMYKLKRGKHSQNTSAIYNNNATQPIVFRAEYDPLSQRDAVTNWNNDPHNISDMYPGEMSLEAGNYELYGNGSDTSLHKSDPIYQSIGSLKQCIDDNDSCCSSTPINNKMCDEPRYIEPRKIDFGPGGNSSKNLETYLSDKGEICTQVVDIADDASGNYASPPSYCGEEEECGNKMIVDLSGDEEPRYSTPPGRK